jgi:hypothetical protein
MDNHEKALLTYEILQKRKKARESKRVVEVDSYKYGAICKANKTRYRHYYSRNVVY